MEEDANQASNPERKTDELFVSEKLLNENYRELIKCDSKKLEAIRNGDHRAFNEFYVANIEAIMNFINSFLRNKSSSEEVCQQLFVDIWMHRESIESKSNFKGYLYKMTKSLVLKHIAHKKVKERYIVYRQNEVPHADHAPDAHIISKETALNIKTLLESMPKQQRKVFKMHKYRGLGYDEIAKRLNITNATVRSHLSHAMKELKKRLK